MAESDFNRFMVENDLSVNAKVGRLNDKQFRCLICGVWALASKATPRGWLVVVGQPATAADVARQAHCSLTIAKSTLVLLRSQGMLELDPETGWEHVHDWESVNPEPKVDATAARRQRERRARLKAREVSRESHADVTPDVTDMSRVTDRDGHADVTPPEVKKLEVGRTTANAVVGTRKRAKRTVDQSVPPENFPDSMLPALRAVLPILRRTWDARGGVEPQPRGVGLALLRNLKADHVAVAKRLEHWLTAGKGRTMRCGDVAARLGEWLEREDAAEKVASVTPLPQRDPGIYDRAAGLA